MFYGRFKVVLYMFYPKTGEKRVKNSIRRLEIKFRWNEFLNDRFGNFAIRIEDAIFKKRTETI